MEAIRRFPKSTLGTFARFDWITSLNTFDEIKRIWNEHPDSFLRKKIVHSIYPCPGQPTIDFLVERLNDPEHQFSAIQSLGFLDAVSAAPKFVELLDSTEWHVREMAAQTIGRLRYSPAVPQLEHYLRQAISNREAGKPDNDFEFTLLQAIGRISPPSMRDLFAELADRVKYPKLMLRPLLRSGSAECVELAADLVARLGLASELCAAIVGHDIEDNDFNDVVTVRPFITHDGLLDVILRRAEEEREAKHAPPLYSALSGVAAFHSRRAIEFLERAAKGVPPQKENDKASDHDPMRVARRVLAGLGVAEYVREATENGLTVISNQDIATTLDLRKLAQAPKEMVRELILQRLFSEPAKCRRWLWLLQWYATPDDKAIFEEYEKNEDVAVADTAHSYLHHGFTDADLG
jgi:hypothetical protein